MPLTSQSPERQRYLSFVQPLFATPLVLVADRRATDITGTRVAVARLGGKRIAVERLSTATELLAVATCSADVYLGFRQVAVHFMEQHLTAHLTLRDAFGAAGTTFGPAVRRDLPEQAVS